MRPRLPFQKCLRGCSRALDLHRLLEAPVDHFSLSSCERGPFPYVKAAFDSRPLPPGIRGPELESQEVDPSLRQYLRVPRHQKSLLSRDSEQTRASVRVKLRSQRREFLTYKPVC